jgi:uncharacterized protein (TIGR02145 family)
MKTKINHSSSPILFAGLILLLVSSCKKEDLGDLSVISTAAITNISDITAVSGGTIASTGGTSITASGICWGLSSAPTIADSKSVETASGVGSYVSTLTNLIPNSTYYVRAYATNKAGTTYGDLKTFITLRQGTVLDADGNVYNSIKIEFQTWMIENLKTTHYNDGTEIPYVTNNTAWSELSTPGYCWFNNDMTAKDICGGLYNWHAVNTGKLCPNGWHVPTEDEWLTLTVYLGSSAGGKMKETGFVHWRTPNTGATNQSGFTALPTGIRSYNGFYEGLTTLCWFWSSTAIWNSVYHASFRSIEYNNETLRGVGMGAIKENGLSVRCIKN